MIRRGHTCFHGQIEFQALSFTSLQAAHSYAALLFAAETYKRTAL
jgi:hypothetical protein